MAIMGPSRRPLRLEQGGPQHLGELFSGSGPDRVVRLGIRGTVSNRGQQHS